MTEFNMGFLGVAMTVLIVWLVIKNRGLRKEIVQIKKEQESRSPHSPQIPYYDGADSNE